MVGKKLVCGPTVVSRARPATTVEHAGGQNADGAEAPDQPRGDAERQRGDSQRPRQEREAGLQRAVVEDVLEVERAEEEGRVHAGDEEAPHDARADQARARAGCAAA